MRKILSFLLALILTVSLVPSQTTQAKEIFKDVPTHHHYYDEIMYLLENDVIVESSLYGLNDIVTREEVAVMVAKAVGLDGTPRATKFSDVPKSNPNSGYIQNAADEGILGGYPDGTFKSKTKVTRGQMAVFIANAFDLPSGDKVFKDVKPGQTGYDQIKKLVSAGITSGYADRTFKPNNNLSRAHISLFLVKAMEYERGLSHEVVLEFPAERYPQTAAHILNAIENGESPVCTIDRAGADENRELSLKGIPTKEGYDRDEWPMAMCEEGGEGADVAYVESSDNRGSGSWVGNQLEKYPNGTRVLFKVVGDVDVIPTPTPVPTPTPQPKPDDTKSYANCTELRKDYPNGVSKDHPAYQTKMDRDGDGYACDL